MDQAHLLGVAHAGAAGLGVFDDVQGHAQLRLSVHVDMADAGAGLDAGDQGVLHTGADQPRAAPRDQQVHQPHGGHQLMGALAGGILDKAYQLPGQLHGLQPRPQGLRNGIGGAERLLASPEDAHAAALERQGGGIGGDVGAALIDDRHHPHGDRHLADHQAVGPLHCAQHPAHRVRQGRHLAHPLRHPGNPLLRQRQPVQQHRAGVGGLQVLGVGREDLAPPGPEAVRHGQQGRIFGIRTGPHERRARRPGGFQDLLGRHMRAPPFFP